VVNSDREWDWMSSLDNEDDWSDIRANDKDKTTLIED
jgi:hypothetical protein